MVLFRMKRLFLSSITAAGRTLGNKLLISKETSIALSGIYKPLIFFTKSDVFSMLCSGLKVHCVMIMPIIFLESFTDGVFTHETTGLIGIPGLCSLLRI